MTMKSEIYVFSPPHVFGGAEIFLIRLAGLMAVGLRFVVLSPQSPRLQQGVEDAGARFVELYGGGGLAIRLQFLKWLWHQRSHLRKTRATFVLNGRGAMYFAPLVRLLTGIAPVVICHTELSTQHNDIKEILSGMALKSCRHVIAVSDSVHAQYCQRWAHLPLQAIPNWINPAELMRPVASMLETGLRLSIAVVGRLAENKGISAIALVCEQMPSVDIHFYGDGPMRDYLDQVALRLPHVTVHGHVTDLAHRLAGHAMLLSASFSESFSYAVAEGINAGLLCIASDIPAHRELLGEEYPQSLYFAPGTVGALTAALETACAMLSDPAAPAAHDAVRRAQARLHLRNGPELARRRYEAVLFGSGGAGPEDGLPAVLANAAEDHVARH